ncbi:MG2 domain-containing protein [Variovorax sp. YR752]|uniref:alpha-2-macroglobulin family protein n=1 Tax=Variovorax sp. YR752 TaxID=1884383 RepID=UPI00313842AD
MASLQRAAALALSIVSGSLAQAASITGVTPRGEVAQVRQVTVRFGAAVVPFGDLRQPDPMVLACEGPVPTGSGRWANDRTWLYDFAAPLPPGARCTLKAKPGWKPLDGTLTGASEFSFGTGGPAVLNLQPWQGSTIEEDQHFLAQLSGAATPASVAANAWCEIEGIGERVPLRSVTGAERDAVLKARRLDKLAERTLLLACQRPLPNDVRLRIVWGRGIAAQANPKVVTSVEQRFDYRVRSSFQVEFSCERERAEAPCLPIRPMTVGFSAPVPRALAAQIRLKPASGNAIAPQFDKDDKAEELSSVQFPVPLPENAVFTIELPAGLKDSAGRALANSASFPLKVATGDAPPIAKFAAAPFGIVEREGLRDGAAAVLPLTLRHVQGDLRPAAAGGQVRVRRLSSDADVLAWYAKLRRHHETQLTAKELGLPERDWFDTVEERDAKGRVVRRKVERMIATREVPLLAGDAQAKRLELPQLAGGDPRPFEVIGVPLAEPGFHVVEIESQRLGASLLDKKAPMYVRTGVLATNLGVHFKHGRDNALVWVTSLDRGKPVADAEVAVNDCRGTSLWRGRTDASGLARIAQALPAAMGDCPADEGLFVTARKTDPADAGGATDMAFVFSSWQEGIEPWRFDHPTASDTSPDVRAHSVLDRTLLRAGETVSMKHFLRTETSAGLALLASDALPDQLKIVHEGSGQEFSQPLQWSGTRSAVSSWNIPAAAKLGSYRIVLERTGGKAQGDERQQRSWDSGEFRVEEFRLPLVDARLSGPKEIPFAPSELPLSAQLNFFSGGAMGNAPVKLSALLRERSVFFDGFDGFSFTPPRDLSRAEAGDDEDSPRGEGKLVADKLALTTDRQGAASVTLKELPKIARPSDLLAELTYADPNGEVQTVSTTLRLWPAAVVPGIRASSWASVRGKMALTALALDTNGKPIKGQVLEVKARLAQTFSTRKRIVGGFYAYDNRTELKELGTLCSGTSDDRGQLACEATLDNAGQVELIVTAKDAAGRSAQAATGVWVTKQGELWFAQDNDDRIDLLPEKKRYEPGETATLQLRMPFREATALLAIEREGVIESRVVTVRGDDPTIQLKIDKAWAPNVYVSVLALRGRIREVPWYSFFAWGWRQPVAWWRAFRDEGPDYQAPTAMVDLAKPAFKLGVAALQVGLAAHELKVSVVADQPQYAVRQTAKARIKVLHEGQALAGTEVAFAAVDEGLLALRGNASWDLLHQMLRQRAWGVSTATGQSEIIGRRHYGRKAVAAGGGGGQGGARELFDTLLVWQPRVTLDANGEAVVDVPLNDSLTSFRLVAIADEGVQRFGSGSTSIRVTQDLQVLSGLPPLVREGDRFAAMLTLRNTTARTMKLRATLAGTANSGGAAEIVRTPLNLPPQEITLAPGAAQELSWPVDVPAEAFSIAWEAAVDEQGGAAKDRLKVTQLVSAAVPVRVLQATLAQLDGAYALPIAAPADALPVTGVKRGGVAVALQPKLTGALPGLRRFFETYPFACLEQKVSKAVGLRDAALWTEVGNVLPTYLDSDGLASYFPPRAEDGARGSDRLTAYLIAATHEAGFALPPAARDAMLGGLTAFVEGRIERKFWSPRADLDVRKIAAIEALSRHGRAQPRMLGSVNVTPNLWPTAAVIDWLGVLKRVDGIPERAKRIEEAQQILRARLTYAGTTLRFSTEEEDFWWWLMDSADANAARLILATLDEPGWKEDLPRLVVGSLARQKRGAWLTTTANLWGSLALDKFAAKFEAEKVAGLSTATTGAAPQAIDWSRSAEGGRLLLPWPDAAGTLNVKHDGSGKPWLTVQSLAAIPLKAPLRAGYAITRSISAVEQKEKGRWSRGDVMRVRLEIDAQSDMTWVVVSDPVPGGATLLGSGLGRDSALATRGEQREGSAWAAYEERSFEAFRSYYQYLPRGKHVVEYSVRLNNPGRFALPPTRVEAMYAPESFGEVPNAVVEVAP